MQDGAGRRLLTVGHGTLEARELVELLQGPGVEEVVDVRSAPGSRRHPHFRRGEMEWWLPAAGIEYRWERELGGFRKPDPSSPNTALRHAGFRAYADHMRTAEFAAALDRLLDGAARRTTACLCAESLWWRCHRRLLADAAVLTQGAEVLHLLHDGRLEPHRPTEEARVGADGLLVYDRGETPSLPLE